MNTRLIPIIMTYEYQFTISRVSFYEVYKIWRLIHINDTPASHALNGYFSVIFFYKVLEIRIKLLTLFIRMIPCGYNSAQILKKETMKYLFFSQIL